MKAIQKADGTTYEPDGQGKVNLEHPSVISLPIAPEQVTRFERRGTDLVLVLEEGREILVEAFFTTYPDDGRNDLVLEDGA